MMENKIKIIDAIVERHPSYGVDKGWSHYTGGMMDSGDWYFRKMLNVPIEELQLFLDNLIAQEIAEKSKTQKGYTQEELADMKIIKQTPNGGYASEYEIKKMKIFLKELQRKIFS